MSDTGATVASLKRRLSWVNGVFSAPLVFQLMGVAMLLLPLPGLFPSDRSLGTLACGRVLSNLLLMSRGRSWSLVRGVTSVPGD